MTYTYRWSHRSRPELDHRLVTLYKNRPTFIKVDSSQIKVHENEKWIEIGSEKVYFKIRHSENSIMVPKSDKREHLMVIRTDW